MIFLCQATLANDGNHNNKTHTYHTFPKHPVFHFAPLFHFGPTYYICIMIETCTGELPLIGHDICVCFSRAYHLIRQDACVCVRTRVCMCLYVRVLCVCARARVFIFNYMYHGLIFIIQIEMNTILSTLSQSQIEITAYCVCSQYQSVNTVVRLMKPTAVGFIRYGRRRSDRNRTARFV